MSDYCTVDELKGRLFAEGQEGGLADEERMASAVAAASRWIEEYCGRKFTSATETRYYTAAETEGLDVDDLLSVTSLQTDEDGDRTYEITWTAADYDLLPFNAGMDGRPYFRIEITPEGDYNFPKIRKGVKIVGSWGYSATAPAAIKEATMLMAARLYKRGDAPFGVVGSPETGMVKLTEKLDGDVIELVRPFVKWF